MPKLTRELKKGLALLANQLPAATAPFRQKLTGQQLLAEGTTHLPGGEKIKPKDLYQRTAEQPINHVRRLRVAFVTKGRPGVLDYCEPFIEPQHFGLFSAKLSELVPAA